jgi:hypothetical protein
MNRIWNLRRGLALLTPLLSPPSAVYAQSAANASSIASTKPGTILSRTADVDGVNLHYLTQARAQP